MNKSENSRELFEKLARFAEAENLSWVKIAEKLGVNQNTMTNWKKGHAISIRNRRAIRKLLQGPMQGCSLDCCFRDTTDPIALATLKILGSMDEQGRVMVYMYALSELRKRTNAAADGSIIAAETPEH